MGGGKGKEEGEGRGGSEAGAGSGSGTGSAATSRGMLLKRLEDYDGSDINQNPPFEIAVIPPEYEPTPCKPLLFDLAFNFIRPPDLSHKLSAAPKADAEKRNARRDVCIEIPR